VEIPLPRSCPPCIASRGKERVLGKKKRRRGQRISILILRADFGEEERIPEEKRKEALCFSYGHIEYYFFHFVKLDFSDEGGEGEEP